MRVVLQRVSEAHVSIDCEIVGQIGRGLLVFVGVEEGDTVADAEWLFLSSANLTQQAFTVNMELGMGSTFLAMAPDTA